MRERIFKRAEMQELSETAWDLAGLRFDWSHHSRTVGCMIAE